MKNDEQALNDSFAHAPILGLILRMAMPAVAAQLVNLLYSIVDRIYIGHIPEVGAQALAGVGICNTVIILVAAFAQFVGGGGSPLASIALGQGNTDRAESILGQGVTLLVIFSIVTTLPTYVFMTPILKVIGASAVTMPYAKDYLSVYLLGTFFVMVNIGLNQFLNIQGRPKAAMISILLGAGLNIVLDPILIYACGMGVVGAAVATVISQGVSAGFILWILLSPGTLLRIRRCRLRLDPDIVSKIMALGTSLFVMCSTESLVGLFMNHGLAEYGDIYISTLTVIQSAMMIVSTPLQGFGQGCNPIISYNYGNGNRKRIISAFRLEILIMTVYNFLAILFMILCPRLVARLFTSDPELIQKVGEIMPIFLLGMTIFGLQRACQNTFVAMGQAKSAIFIALLRKAVLLIPLTLILPHFMGVMGIYGAEAIADATACIICVSLFACRFPKILKGMPKKEAHEQDASIK